MRDSLRSVLQRAWLQRSWLACCLWPLSRVYAFIVKRRHRAYTTGQLAAHKIAAPVLVVGNVVAGGVGKTPVVIALVDHLRSQGWALGVVARGYGRQLADCREVQPTSRASEVGDEPLLIARHFAQNADANHLPVSVFVAPQRVQAARALLLAYPQTQLIISDDGLQHYALQRDLEVCVFDGRGLGNGWLLPAGPLREPWPRTLARKPCLLLHTGERAAQGLGQTGFYAKRRLAGYALRSNGQRMALSELLAHPQPLLALAGIAHPDAFFSMLRGQGLSLAHALALPDHYDFNRFTCPSDKPYQVICTEKDAVKLWPLFPDALAVPLVLSLEPGFVQAIDAWLLEHVPSGPVRPAAPVSSGNS